ncbi:hypothetical protein JR316_0008628 [Psilocybe cubensis]|uniref:Uncharacterized protein n=2 Tax=Psilocybe cubensis TaxID=181762 RepID=A0ACB8GT60_PSICU|nr:hypothetical protein JR316_0008628 [Psilocybe cubensis]KAH9478175.1 hypothetical protein JR316_0008628 [Psilocybe cubensis]
MRVDIFCKDKTHIVQTYIDDIFIQFNILSIRNNIALLNIGHINSYMALAHVPDGKFQAMALAKVRYLIRRVEKIPQYKRTAAQRYLLEYWREPAFQYNDPRSPVAFRLPLVVYADASRWGIGVSIPSIGLSLAWYWDRVSDKLPVGRDNQIVMSWAELIAVEVAIHTLITMKFHRMGYPLVLLSDNKGVVNALNAGRWKDAYNLDGIVDRIERTCGRHKMFMEIYWVPSYANIADKPSRGRFVSKEGIRDMVRLWEEVDKCYGHSRRGRVVPKALKPLIHPAHEQDITVTSL